MYKTNLKVKVDKPGTSRVVRMLYRFSLPVYDNFIKEFDDFYIIN
jgi:hypothetical protein